VDDAKVGVKSTALLFGDSTVYWNLGFTVISIGCFLLAGYNGGLGKILCLISSLYLLGNFQIESRPK
jgi:4-hydroxybenzoate polyprenyltransferase